MPSTGNALAASAEKRKQKHKDKDGENKSERDLTVPYWKQKEVRRASLVMSEAPSSANSGIKSSSKKKKLKKTLDDVLDDMLEADAGNNNENSEGKNSGNKKKKKKKKKTLDDMLDAVEAKSPEGKKKKGSKNRKSRGDDEDEDIEMGEVAKKAKKKKKKDTKDILDDEEEDNDVINPLSPSGKSTKTSRSSKERNSNDYTSSSRDTKNNDEDHSDSDHSDTEEEEEEDDDDWTCSEFLVWWSYKYLGPQFTTWIIRKRHVLFRFFICFAYFLVGVEFYHRMENWSRTDAVYFITVSTTTVGYGDLHPTNDNTRLFTIFYVIFGVAIVLSSAQQVIQYVVVNKLQQYMLACLDNLVRNYYHHCTNKVRESSSLETQAWVKLVFSVSMVIGMMAAGSLFYFANEDFTYIQALYWTVCTMLTIGYGDLSLTNESSRVFSTWFIWLCVIVYVMAITNIMTTFEELKMDALRLEILKHHAVDVIDVLQSESDNQQGETRMTSQVGTGDLFQVMADGITGRNDDDIDSSVVNRRKKSIALLQKSMSAMNDDKPGDDYSSIYGNLDYNGGSFHQNNPLAMSSSGSMNMGSFRQNSYLSERSSLDEKTLERAKENAFVIEMLLKMKKVNKEKDIDALTKHYRKIAALKSDGSSTEHIREAFRIGADSDKKTMLGNIAQSMIKDKRVIAHRNASIAQGGKRKGTILGTTGRPGGSYTSIEDNKKDVLTDIIAFRRDSLKKPSGVGEESVSGSNTSSTTDNRKSTGKKNKGSSKRGPPPPPPPPSTSKGGTSLGKLFNTAIVEEEEEDEEEEGED